MTSKKKPEFGQVICHKCRGNGEVKRSGRIEVCPRCNGDGYLSG